MAVDKTSHIASALRNEQQAKPLPQPNMITSARQHTYRAFQCRTQPAAVGKLCRAFRLRTTQKTLAVSDGAGGGLSDAWLTTPRR
eukprot:6187547-Pleurochrysis_carterae.AAC.1